MSKLGNHKLITKIKSNGKVFTRGLTFLPPLLGVIIFTYLVKYSGFNSVPKRIPVYQGLTAYFSLILLGFTYIKNRYNVFGKKIIPIIIVIILFPISFYAFNAADITFILLFVFIQFFTFAINYIALIKGNVNNYLLLGCFNSVVLPFCLAVNDFSLFVICMVLLVLFVCLFIPIKNKLGLFSYSENGVNIVKSFLLQSPLIILPFFDFKIAELIGAEKYSNYVLLFKYINGFIAVMFSYKQLNLTFSGDLLKKQMIVYQMIVILAVLIICSTFGNNYVFALSIALFSYGINLSSLLIRKALLDGVPLRFTIIGLASVLAYILLIYNCGVLISTTNSAFITFMFMASFITALSVNGVRSKT